jgi:H+/Cl- antiporter ClcA
MLVGMIDAPRSPSGFHRFTHSTGQRILGFLWMFIAAMFIAIGTGIGILGIAGGILVRWKPETQRNINYDPSTIALLAPLPFLFGCLLFWMFIARTRRLTD